MEEAASLDTVELVEPDATFAAFSNIEDAAGAEDAPATPSEDAAGEEGFCGATLTEDEARSGRGVPMAPLDVASAESDLEVASTAALVEDAAG